MAFEVTDTGIGIAPEQLRDDLRGVPAGRRHDQPQVRRHRPRPVDQPRDRAADRRRDPRGERPRARQHVHAVPAGPLRRRRPDSLPRDRRDDVPARVETSRSPQLAELIHETVADDEGAILDGDRVLLVALAEPDLCRAAVEHRPRSRVQGDGDPPAGRRPRGGAPARPGRRDRRHGHGHPRRRVPAARAQAAPADAADPGRRHASPRRRPRTPTRVGSPARST